MLFFWGLAIAAGVAGVIQNGLNKKLSPQFGLAFALHMSNLMVLVGGIFILTLISSLGRGEIAQMLKLKIDLRTWNWMILVPGLMGLFFLVVTPIAMSRLGAMKVFVAIVFGEVLTSCLWDYWLEHKGIDRWRVLGCVFTLIGAACLTLSEA